MALEAITCSVCGVEFGAPEHFLICRRQDGKAFFCPNGHSLSYGEGENAKLRRERDRLAQQIAQRDDELKKERNKIVAAKGQITRLQKRAKAGVCPCCNRSVRQLALHMKTQHPDFNPDNVVSLENTRKLA